MSKEQLLLEYLVIQGIDQKNKSNFKRHEKPVVGSNNMAWSKNRRAVTVIQ